MADHVCAPVDHVPAPGELVLTSRMELSVGGCAANVALDLAKLGHRASVVGRVGDDSFGRFIRQSLDAAGVGTTHLRESPGKDTSGTLVINSRGEDRRFILYLGGYCLMDALSPDVVAKVFHVARSAGIVTVLDVVIPRPGRYWERLEPVLPHTDVFCPNNDESRIITGLEDPVEQARAFRSAGVESTIITCGKAGAVLIGRQETLRAGSYPVNFVDGTGSGDAFIAGYMHGLLTQSSAADCLRYGSALGASCVRATGATAGVFNRHELGEFVASNPLPLYEL